MLRGDARPCVYRENIHPSTMPGTRAVLHLNGTYVGDIHVKGWDTSWTYGTFTPAESFSEFATIFGRGSLLMHEDESLPLRRDIARELRDAELHMDELRARVYFPDDGMWH